MIKILTRDYLATYTYLESEIKRIRRRIKHTKTIRFSRYAELLRDPCSSSLLQNVILLFPERP